jgi:tetratricopeptide (TPR) repeat protein
MKKVTVFLIAGLTFFLFSSMAWVRINLLKPALYVYPEYIKTVAILDRSAPLDAEKNKIEEAVTLEMYNQDEQAVRRVMDGLIDACSEFNLYQLEKINERYPGGGKKAVFPKPMSWDKIASLCQKYQVDAILAIEIFDSDFIVTNPAQVVKQAVEGVMNPGRGIDLNGIAIVNFGIRLYDPVSKKIADEYQVSHRVTINAGAYSVQDAINYVMNKVEAINQAGYFAGRTYGERITPSYYTVVREFYNKPRKNIDIRMGVRKSEVADWNGAIEDWTRALNAKRRIAGRAAYNIAVGWEVLGDIEKAKEWASRAYTDYNEKMAKYYYDQLVYRQNEEAIIRRQIPQGE